MAEATKSKTGLIIIIVVAILIIGVVVYMFRDKLFGVKCDPNRNGFDRKGNPNPKCQFNNPATNNEPAPSGSGGWISDANFPIRKGSWGPKVAALQKAIGVEDDGKFGPITEATLIKKTGKKDVASQADYDKIVNPAPIGGNNFDKVKVALGSSAKVYTDSVGIDMKGEKNPFLVTFFTNNRVSFKDVNANKFYNGSFSDGGKEISIDSKDGGYSTGTWISNSDVFESMNKIIAKIEGN